MQTDTAKIAADSIFLVTQNFYAMAYLCILKSMVIPTINYSIVVWNILYLMSFFYYHIYITFSNTKSTVFSKQYKLSIGNALKRLVIEVIL